MLNQLKIEQKDIEDILPLSSMQAGMLFNFLENPKSNQYFEQLTLQIKNQLEMTHFRKAWEHVVQTNEMLRTVIRWDKLQKPVQLILKQSKLEIRFYDLSREDSSKADRLLNEKIMADRREYFDFNEVPFRITVIRQEKERHILLISFHHILFDGWSLGIILKEFMEKYRNLASNLSLEQKVKPKFKQYIKKLHELPLDKRYWETYLQGLNSVAQLPVQHFVQTPNVCKYSQIFSSEITEKLNLLVKEENLTLAAIFYTAWGIILQKMSYTTDAIFGTTISGRNIDLQGIEDMVGLFINTIPLRIQTQSEQTILTLLKDTQKVLLERVPYEHMPLVEIKQHCNLHVGESLFDSIVVIENYPLENILFDESNILALESYNMFESTNLPLTVSIETFQNVCINLIYQEQAFTTEFIERIAVYFERVVHEIINHPTQHLKSLRLLSPAEEKQMLQQLNNTHAEYPREKTLQQIFEEQVKIYADRIAVVYEDAQLSYAELNKKANQLAHLLQEKGVGPDKIVAIMFDRSLEMVIGILAILKAGGAYLPITPEYPAERINYILENSGTSILLTSSQLAEKVEFAGELVCMDKVNWSDYRVDNLPCINRSENLAYIIYTSGSTGKPKGVMIEHRNVVRLMTNEKFLFDFNQNDVWSLFHSFCFDFSVWEMYGALLYGGKLIIIPREIAKNTTEFLKILREEQVTVLNQTPTAFYNLLAEEIHCNDSRLPLRYIIFGGEALNVAALASWKEKYPETHLINMYGITETTVHVTFKELLAADIAANICNIGVPIPTLQVYIMDQDLHMLPYGMVGEICVAGEGVARGYLNLPELTNARFVNNVIQPDNRIYRSGDLARILPNGDLEYLGRADQQVKIRGFRIELGEIESHLLQHPVIEKVVVLVRKDQQEENSLWAYIVSRQDVTTTALRKYLSETLPDYMIPAYFVRVKDIPCTVNGKVDRKALLTMAEPMELDREYVPPTNPIEEIMASIWAELLNVDTHISVTDNFFELGGHSLKMTALISKIHKELNVQIPLQTIIKYPTIRELSQYIFTEQHNLYQELKPIEKYAFYPVSSAQKRMYVLHQLAEDTLNYNMTGVLRLKGELDLSRLRQVLNTLVKRHESMRTSFKLLDGEPVQIVHELEELVVEPKIIDLSEQTTSCIEEVITKLIQPFNLEIAPLFRISLIVLPPSQLTEALLVFDMHHIIADGISLEIIKQEFVQLYHGEDLASLKLQYKDYAAASVAMQNSDMMKRKEQFWLNNFSGEIPVLNLQTDEPRALVQNFAGDCINLSIDEELLERLKVIAKTNKATLYMVLLAAYNVLLYRYTGQTDLVVGSPVSGRLTADVQNIVGMFVNTIALRSYPDGEKKFRTFLAEVRENALLAYANQDYPLEELIDKLGLVRELSRNPLFDTVLALQNMDKASWQFTDLQVESYPYKNKVAKFDLTMNMIENNARLDIELEYSTQLFHAQTVKRFGEHYVKILGEIADNPECTIAGIEMLSSEEKAHILNICTTNQRDLPEVTFQYLFEQQVESTPDQIAVVYGDTKLTYHELNARANQLANVLREYGVKRETITAIMLEHCPEMVVSVLAVLKLGGAFLPIAPDLPLERVEYMLQDANVAVLLSDQNLTDLRITGTVLNAKDYSSVEAIGNVSGECSPDNLAYVIYTSGTTGKPKGVLIEQRALVNLCIWHNQHFAITSNDHATKLAGFGFDASVWEMMPYLIAGASLYLIPEDLKLNLVRLNQYFEEQNITVAFLPTQLCEQFMQFENHSLRLLLTGGDKLKSFVKHDYQLVNNYGPTENTVVSTSYIVTEPSRNIPIGQPIDNVQVYILDKYQNLQPVGVPGELCLGGRNLARGYLNQPELTSQKFTSNPFNSTEKLYHTGDCAILMSDGNIAFLGRMDDQIQLRGYRIEVGEIESALINHTDIKESLVFLQEDSTDSSILVAYIVSERDWTARELHEYLAKSLPSYMIPAAFMQVDYFPTTSNGKIDRQKLAEMGTKIISGVEYEAPQTSTEVRLVEIWEALLETKVGVNDNFFILGGHSLKAVNLVSEIQKHFNIDLPLSSIFRYSSIRELAQLIDNQLETINEVAVALENKSASIIPVKDSLYYPVTPAQKRMYVLNQMETQSTAYNMPTVLKIHGDIDQKKLEAAFCQLIARHEALRTGFMISEGETVQNVISDFSFTLECFTVEKDAIQQRLAEFLQPFDLSKPPLLKGALLRVIGEDDLLVIDMHHIISDGQSMQIFIKELVAIYEDKPLADLPLQYKDYAMWLKKQLNPVAMKHQEAYWLNEFQGEIPVLDMPTDYPRPAFQSFEGSSIRFALDNHTSKRFKTLMAENNVTMYMAFLAIYNILLAKLTGQEDIVVGMPISGRRGRELEQVMGMFVNTLALRNQPDGELTFTKFLQQVKDKMINTFDHQDYQFEELVDQVVVKRDLSRNPIFDTMLVLQTFAEPSIKGNNFELIPYEIENKIAKFDLELSVFELENQIRFILDYCTKLFKQETIERFSQYFIRIIENVIENPSVCLKDIEILSLAEREQLIIDFNNNRADFPTTQSIHHFVEYFAANHPDKIAIKYEHETLSYGELNSKVNQMAQVLKQYGLGEDRLVGILLERSPLMAISILAVWKAGGAYIPLDVEYPEERIATIIEDSHAHMLLTTAEFGDFDGKLPNECIIFDVSKNLEKLQNMGNTNLDLPLNMHSLAYVIYTSGSTGKPKGAMVEHIGMMNHMQAKINDLHLTNESIIAQNASQCFDISVWQFFVALRVGGTTVIYSKELVLTPDQLIARVIADKVTIFEVVPSYLSALLDTLDAYFRELPDLRYLLVTGEIVKPTLVKRWFAKYPKLKMVNAYGPTEASDDITHYIMEQAPEVERIPVGKPVQNFNIYIVDKYMHLVPIGVKGEICVSGVGVGRGYLNNPEKTHAAFMNDPLIKETRRLYKTGDLGCWFSEGVIDFYGRKDYQVKIRGFRIELGEIESVLCSHPQIKEAVVLDREDQKHEKYLCAYIVSTREIGISEMREYLLKKLPDYMIPSELIKVEQIPLNANGKTDRKALLKIEGKGAGLEESYIAPQSDLEKRIAVIWREVLQVEKIGVNDNFFDVGGNSFDIIAVKNKLTQEFKEEIPVVTFFKYPTIRSLVHYFEQLKAQEVALGTKPLEQYDRSETIDKGKNRLKQRMNRRGD